MTSHLFRVGQLVTYKEERSSGVAWGSEYEVMDLLDTQASEPQYQVRCTDQSHHRIVGEHELGTAAQYDTTRALPLPSWSREEALQP